MSYFEEVTIEVPAEAIQATADMNEYDRKCFMANHHYIPASHLYGYGVYSGVTAVDDTHIKYTIGTSCD